MRVGSRRVVLCTVLVFALLASGCGGNAEDDADTEAATGEDEDAEATGSLAGICPDKIVLQTDWFPEGEHGASYQLIGPGGTVDIESGSYTGPLGDTGVDLEIRAGGPYIGGQPPVAQLYSDDDIFIAYADTASQILSSADLPTVSVLAPLEKTPQILMFDPATYEFETFEDIGESGARVLYFEGGTYMDWLLAKGLLTEEQVDSSYDGSPSQFVSSDGAVVQQGYATHEPFDYESTIEQWLKPVDFLLVADAGYEIYQSSIVARPETIEEHRECFTALVPLMQQAMVDYLADPAPVNTELVRIAEELATFWVLTEEGNAYTTESMIDLGIVGNGSDGTHGNFDTDRVQALIDDLLPIFEANGLDSFDPELAPEDIVTNEFVDPSISLEL